MLWLKAFHVASMVTWFAGIFYLPRLFVYHVDAKDREGLERFVVMERRLYALMSIGAGATVAFGTAMLVAQPAYLTMGWLHAKLALVAVLIGYHFYCRKLAKDLSFGRNAHTARWYRLFNEVPALLLLGIVILAVVKPF